MVFSLGTYVRNDMICSGSASATPKTFTKCSLVCACVRRQQECGFPRATCQPPAVTVAGKHLTKRALDDHARTTLVHPQSRVEQAKFARQQLTAPTAPATTKTTPRQPHSVDTWHFINVFFCCWFWFAWCLVCIIGHTRGGSDMYDGGVSSYVLPH